MAAGRYTSHAASSGFLLFLLRSMPASLPEKVVLPEPCKPAIRMTAGCPFSSSSEAEAPMSVASSSCTIFTITWFGLSAVSTFWPMALVFTVSVNCLATL